MTHLVQKETCEKECVFQVPSKGLMTNPQFSQSNLQFIPTFSTSHSKRPRTPLCPAQQDHLKSRVGQKVVNVNIDSASGQYWLNSSFTDHLVTGPLVNTGPFKLQIIYNL